jgi:hypothetical protein
MPPRSLWPTELDFPAAPAPVVPTAPAPVPTPRPIGANLFRGPHTGFDPRENPQNQTEGDVKPPNDTPAPTNTGCPPGQVPKSTGQGCKPAGQWYDESEDELSKAGKETCDPMAHPGIKDGRYDCYWCDFTTRQWKRGYCPDSGAAGAGGPGGPGGPRTAPDQALVPGAGSTNFAAIVEQILKDSLDSPSRYTPEALQGMYGEVTRQYAGQVRRGERGVRADAARRGMGRAGRTDALLRGVRDTAEAQRGQSIVGIQTEKIRADFADKMAGLDRAQKYLDSLRDNEYRYMLAAEQRRQFDANLRLGYANLDHQRSLLNMQLQSAWDMLRANQGFLLLNQGL